MMVNRVHLHGDLFTLRALRCRLSYTFCHSRCQPAHREQLGLCSRTLWPRLWRREPVTFSITGRPASWAIPPPDGMSTLHRAVSRPVLLLQVITVNEISRQSEHTALHLLPWLTGSRWNFKNLSRRSPAVLTVIEYRGWGGGWVVACGHTLMGIDRLIKKNWPGFCCLYELMSKWISMETDQGVTQMTKVSSARELLTKNPISTRNTKTVFIGWSSLINPKDRHIQWGCAA